MIALRTLVSITMGLISLAGAALALPPARPEGYTLTVRKLEQSNSCPGLKVNQSEYDKGYFTVPASCVQGVKNFCGRDVYLDGVDHKRVVSGILYDLCADASKVIKDDDLPTYAYEKYTCSL